MENINLNDPELNNEFIKLLEEIKNSSLRISSSLYFRIFGGIDIYRLY